jgi:pimeloyl-ACP methyl ester carboxylesterase
MVFRRFFDALIPLSVYNVLARICVNQSPFAKKRHAGDGVYFAKEIPMSKIYINDANIYYEEHGQGSETILFIHGLFMNCRMYDHQVEALKDRYRCVVFDLRGQGSSEVTAGGYGIYDLVDDAAKLIEQLDCGPCHVAGISMGGFIALRLAKLYPQLVRSLTLISTSAAAEARSDAAKFKFLGFIHHRVSQPFAVSQVEPILFGQAYLEDPDCEEEKAYWHQHLLDNDKQGISRSLNGILARDSLLDELSTIDVPSLIIAGEVDAAMAPVQSERMHAELPNSRLVRIPEVGHTPPLESSEAVTSAMAEFLDSVPAAADRSVMMA